MEAYIYFSRYEGGNVRTTNRIKANNEAYASNSTVDVVNEDNVVIDSFKPTSIDRSGLIDGGFHNYSNKNQ